MRWVKVSPAGGVLLLSGPEMETVKRFIKYSNYLGLNSIFQSFDYLIRGQWGREVFAQDYYDRVSVVTSFVWSYQQAGEGFEGLYPFVLGIAQSACAEFTRIDRDTVGRDYSALLSALKLEDRMEDRAIIRNFLTLPTLPHDGMGMDELNTVAVRNLGNFPWASVFPRLFDSTKNNIKEWKESVEGIMKVFAEDRKTKPETVVRLLGVGV